jgi:beta-glucosidase
MKDIASIVQQMTLAEKAALVTGATPWTTTPVARLGVPELFVADGPHGVRRVEDVNTWARRACPPPASPPPRCLAATWDADLLPRWGRRWPSEAIALNVGVMLGPGVNMKRSPLCGRNFEYFSEDPFLAGELAASLIEGMQSKGRGHVAQTLCRQQSGVPALQHHTPRSTSARCARSICRPLSAP